MSFEKTMGYNPYKFKFDSQITLFIKSKEEVTRINKALKEESPESDYESYSWYLADEKLAELKDQRLKIEMQVSWHGGLPFYRVNKDEISGTYDIAEFYLNK